MPTPAEIAARGVKRIRVGDREHEFFSPMDLREYDAAVAADALDEEYGGFVNVKMEKPT